MVKCVYCIHNNDGHCTGRRGIRFNDFVNPIEDIECPAYIGAGFVTIEGRPQRNLRGLATYSQEKKKGEKMEIEHNGGTLKTYTIPCLKGTCGDKIIEAEEIGYLNGVMHVRCKECGYIESIDLVELPERP